MSPISLASSLIALGAAVCFVTFAGAKNYRWASAQLGLVFVLSYAGAMFAMTMGRESAASKAEIRSRRIVETLSRLNPESPEARKLIQLEIENLQGAVTDDRKLDS